MIINHFNNWDPSEPSEEDLEDKISSRSGIGEIEIEIIAHHHGLGEARNSHDSSDSYKTSMEVDFQLLEAFKGLP